MKTEVLSQEKNIISVKAAFEAEEVNKEINSTIKELSQKANIKGFRKGHVPRKTMELYFGKKGIMDETLENIVSKAIENIVDEYDLSLIAEPDVKPGELNEGSGFEFEVKFEVTPEVKLPELDSITAEKTIFTPTDEMLSENIGRILDAHAELVPTYEERPLTASDYVSIKYTASSIEADGEAKPVEEGVKTEINLGQQGIRPEITNALIGKKPSDTVTVDLTMEEEEKGKESSAKTTRYDIEVMGIMERKVPELTDELASQITQSKHNSADEFRGAVKEQLQVSADKQSEESLKNSAVAKLCEMSEVEIPQTLIDRQKAAMRAEQESRIKRDSGMTMDEFFEKSGMDKESYENELASAADTIVKRSLVLEALADKEDIQWTQQELDAEIRRMALASRVDADKFQKYVYSDRDRLYEIASGIRSRKAIDLLVENVKIVEKPAESAENKENEGKPAETAENPAE